MSPSKRVLSVAVPAGTGWRVSTEPVGDVPSLLDRLRDRAAGEPAVLGIDAPIGLPLAVRGQSTDFPAFLRSIDLQSTFFDVCDAPGEISQQRPFFPKRSRPGVRRQDLLNGLGLADGAELLRLCERRSGSLPAASPLFWTLGANQAGKGAIVLWRDLLAPALRTERPPLLWPFDGALTGLLRPWRIVVAETYPADAMRCFDLGWRGSKRRQADRQAVAAPLGLLLRSLGATPEGELARRIEAGFGNGPNGEDCFDSLLGLLRILQILRDPALDQRPNDDVCRWEGWILGRPVTIG